MLAEPVGVFALALGVGLHAGFGAAGVLFQYVAFVSLVIIGGTLVLYPVVGLWGRVPLRRFAMEIAPVLVVAASTQSSLATLPAIIECARDALGVPPRVAGLVLPLAVAVFRYTSPIGNLAVCFFIAALYGFEPGTLQILTATVVAFAVSVAAVGLPGQVSFITSVAPICLALPVDGAYVCGAVSGYGLMASAAVGELVAAHVTGSALPDYAPTFSIERYDDPVYRRWLENWQPAGQL